MLLSEQNYTNLNRIYYHGVRFNSLALYRARFNSLYITPSFNYAAVYSYKNDLTHGRVFSYKLKQSLNIFNARSKKDIENLKKHFKSNYITLGDRKYKLSEDFVLDYLASRDWILVFDKNISLRDRFVEILKDVGYDGFFNFEWQEDLKKHLHNEKIAPSIYNQPAVGIFNLANLQQLESFSYQDFFKFDEFRTVYEKDKKLLASYLSNIVTLTDEDSETVEVLGLEYASRNSCFLEEEDVFNIVDQVQKAPEKFLEAGAVASFKKGLAGEKIDYRIGGPFKFNEKTYLFEPEQSFSRLSRTLDKYLKC